MIFIKSITDINIIRWNDGSSNRIFAFIKGAESDARLEPEKTSMRNEAQNVAYAALVLRVALGAMFLAHGLLKVFVFTIPGTVGYFQSIGYPGFFAYLVILAEVAGGAALIAGVYARYVALALVPVLIGATLQYLPNGWLFANPKGGWEFPAFWTVTLVVQGLIGDGAYALKPSRPIQAAAQPA